MKKAYLFALAAIFMLAASCSKEGGNETPSDGKAVIGVKFDPSIIYNSSRGLDGQIGDDGTGDSRVTVGGTYAYVYFFDSDGKRIGKESQAKVSELTSGKEFNTSTHGITTQITKVVIIANAPDGLFTDANITSYGDLKTTFVNAEALNELYDTDLGEGKKAPFWLSGEADVTGWTETDGVNKASASVIPSPIFARIDVTVNLAGVTDGLYDMDGQSHANERISLKSVDLLYGATYGTFADAPLVKDDFANEDPEHATSGLIPTDDPYWKPWSDVLGGKKANLLSNTGNGGDFHGSSDWTDNIMHGNFPASVAASATAFQKSFYVFPNAADADAVILTLYGEKDKEKGDNSEQEPIFWPVRFDDSKQGTGGDGTGVKVPLLEKGYVYTISLKLTDDLSGDDQGEPDPEEASSNLQITVSKAAWKGVVKIGEIVFD